MNEESRVDNVILLGAGASFDAGVPMLESFVAEMNRMVLTGSSPRGPLSDSDQLCLQKAMQITHKLESYHARVAIDQFNIEQILSVLAFEAYAEIPGAKDDLKAFTEAIARTVELTCNVLHNGDLNSIQDEGDEVYRKFWCSLFLLYGRRMDQMPTILTFNYDLVLERSLFQYLNGPKSFDALSKSNCRGVSLCFEHPVCGDSMFEIESLDWPQKNSSRGLNHDRQPGFGLTPVKISRWDFATIQILKLHGSLNFPHGPAPEKWSPLKALSNPWIIPPVFNKAEGTFASERWKAGMNALRNCKQLIICGYSLPTTDTYMQYFLKSALGPNRKLQDIYVFDPELFKDGEKGSALRKRYTECFSPQMQKKITFNPDAVGVIGLQGKSGTFAHMVDMIHQKKSILFGVKPQ